MRLLVAALLLAALPLGAAAERPLWSLVQTNDSLGEFRDRWRSASAQAALVWMDARGATELRFRADLMTPENLTRPAPDDRRHAGTLSLGLHRHGTRGGVDWRAGAEAVVIGRQTGLLKLQRELHELLAYPIPTLDDWQIGNRVTARVSGEVSRPFLAGGWEIRPFAEAEAGPEDLLRIGVDVARGVLGDGGFRLRDATSGHRISPGAPEAGWGLALGADVAKVQESVYLPARLGYELTPVRTRVRAGVYRGWRHGGVFYGLTWLSPEFEAQREGQFVGALQARLRF